MKEGRKPEYLQTTPDDNFQKNVTYESQKIHAPTETQTAF